MTATKQATGVSPLAAFVFAVALSVALLVVLVPMLPGEARLKAGDPAFKTFTIGSEVVVAEGRVVTEADVVRIRQAGLLENHLDFWDAVAAGIVAVIGGSLLGLYLYLFQPPEVDSVPRLFLVGLLVVMWVAAAKVFLSLTLPDEDRLYLGYMLPMAAAPMLIATLLDGGLGLAVAALVAVLAAFAGFYLPDA